MNPPTPLAYQYLHTFLKLLRSGNAGLIIDRAMKYVPVLLLRRRFGRAGSNFWVDRPDLILNPRFVTVGNRFRAAKGLRLYAIDAWVNQTLAPQIVIGNNVNLGYYVVVSAINRIEIQDDVLMGSHVLITDHNHGRYESTDSDSPEIPPLCRQLHSPGPVLIGRKTWIGERAVILPNVKIGDGCVIAANSVVTHDLPPHSLVAGSPARAVKHYDSVKGQWLPGPTANESKYFGNNLS